MRRSERRQVIHQSDAHAQGAATTIGYRSGPIRALNHDPQDDAPTSTDHGPSQGQGPDLDRFHANADTPIRNQGPGRDPILAKRLLRKIMSRTLMKSRIKTLVTSYLSTIFIVSSFQETEFFFYS